MPECAMVGCTNTATVEIKQRRGIHGSVREFMPYCDGHKTQFVRSVNDTKSGGSE